MKKSCGDRNPLMTVATAAPATAPTRTNATYKRRTNWGPDSVGGALLLTAHPLRPMSDTALLGVILGTVAVAMFVVGILLIT